MNEYTCSVCERTFRSGGAFIIHSCTQTRLEEVVALRARVEELEGVLRELRAIVVRTEILP